jgi:hypothetical protein
VLQRSTAIGCLLPSNDVSQVVVQKLITDGYKRAIFPELSFAVHTNVQFVSQFMLPYIRKSRLLSIRSFAQVN